MSTKNPKKSLKNYTCENCDYYTSSKKDYNKHLFTSKHEKITNCQHVNIKNPSIDNIMNENISDKKIFICDCGKKYKERSGLWKHKKKCISDNIETEKNEFKICINENIDNNDFKKIIIEVMNQNKELIKTIQELTPKIGNNITNNTNNTNNTNCNNKTFNLQFFLNETCKNAMNINQFVDNIDITMDDLKNTRINGLVEGVSDIIIRGLKQLEVHERPIHCTDLKRHTLYI